MSSIEFQFSDGSKIYTGPSSWDELEDSREFVRLFKLSRIFVDTPFAGFMAFKLLYKIPRKILNVLFGPRLDDRQMLAGMTLIERVRWVWEELPKNRWYLPNVRVFGVKFTGPQDGFAELTFGQFMFADRYFEAAQNKNGGDYKENLHLFLGSLYRPSWQREFSKKKIEPHARWMRFLRPSTQEAILYNYAGLRANLTKKFPEIFTPPKEGNDQQKKSTDGWLGVALSLAGEDLARFHAYEQDELWLVLKIIQNVIIKNKETKRVLDEAEKKRKKN